MNLTQFFDKASRKLAIKRLTILIVNDTRDQESHGSQANVEALDSLLSQTNPTAETRFLPSQWLVDTSHGIESMVKGAQKAQPQAVFPDVADQFEEIADEWERGGGGPGSKGFLKKFEGVDLVLLNGEGSIYRTNLSAMRELFLAWYAKTRLGLPTLFMNGTIHLTDVVPVLPAMVRKTFPLLDAVTVREPYSLRNLQQYVPNVSAKVVPDSAFHLAHLVAENRIDLKESKFHVDGDYFCLDMGPLPNDHRKPGTSALHQLIGELKKLGLQAVLIGKQFPTDRFVEKLAGETNSLYFDPSHTFNDLMSLQANAKFQVAGRYHYLILASIVGCPSIALATVSHKVHGVCELLGGQIGTPHDPTDLRSCTDRIIAQARGYLSEQANLRPSLQSTSLELADRSLELGKLVNDSLGNHSRRV